MEEDSVHPLSKSQLGFANHFLVCVRWSVIVARATAAVRAVTAAAVAASFVNIVHLILVAFASSGHHVSATGSVVFATGTRRNVWPAHVVGVHVIICRANFAVFATTFDTFVAVLVEVGKVFPELLVCLADWVAVLIRGKLGSERA